MNLLKNSQVKFIYLLLDKLSLAFGLAWDNFVHLELHFVHSNQSLLLLAVNLRQQFLLIFQLFFNFLLLHSRGFRSVFDVIINSESSYNVVRLLGVAECTGDETPVIKNKIQMFHVADLLHHFIMLAECIAHDCD